MLIQKLKTFLLDKVLKLFMTDKYKRRAKQSRNRHGVAQRVPGGLGSQVS
jgi:hypothetical protein